MNSTDEQGSDHAPHERSANPGSDRAAGAFAPDQEGLLRQVLEVNPNLIFVKDREGRFTLANKAVADIYGTTVEGLIGRTDADFNPNEAEVEHFRGDDLEVMDSLRERVIGEEVVTDTGGVEHVLHTVKRPIIDPRTGRADHVLGVAVDITERKRTEEAYRFLADAGAALAASLDYETTLANVVRMAVPAIADWCGIDTFDDAGNLRRLAMFHQDEEKLAAVREMHSRYAPGPDAEYGARRVMSTGQPIFVKEIDDADLKQTALNETHYQLIRGLGLRSYICVPLETRGRMLGAVSFATAESGRTYTEDDLQLAMELARRAAIAVDNAMLHRAQQEGEWQYRALIEQVTDYAIFMVDPQGRATTWNEGVQRVLGYDEKDFIGLAISRHFTPEDRKQNVPQAELDEAARSGQASNDRWMLRRDGSRFWASGTTTAIRDEDDSTLIGFAKVMRDLTKQKLAEAELARHRQRLEELVAERTRELQQSNEKLRHAERMAAIGSLSAGLGHDIGNLLLPIQIRLESIETRISAVVSGRVSEEGTDDAFLEDTQAIRSATRHLQRLANGLRLLARDPEDEPGTIARRLGPGRSREAVELGSWWEEVEPLMKNALPPGVLLEGSFAPNLPPARMPRHSLTQAVFNLVQNAGDAMGSHGEGRVVVSARPAEKTDRVELVVADNGPGMTEEVKRRCMEPFFSTKTRAISTGLALSLVHAAVQRAGGTIDIETKPGRGTRFILTLPAADRAGGPAPGRATHPEQRRAALITMSDPRMRTYIASVLRSLDLEVMITDGDTVPVHRAFEPSDFQDPRLKIWVVDAGVARDRVHDFLKGDPTRRAVLVGEHPEGSLERGKPGGDRRIEVLSRRPKTAEIWRALRQAMEFAGASRGAGVGNGKGAGNGDAKGRG